MKIETNAVEIGFGEFLELIHQRNRDPFHEVLETLTEVAEVAYDTHPSSQFLSTPLPQLTRCFSSLRWRCGVIPSLAVS